jgi:lipooligosaccharide transport system permease protein
MSTATGVVVGPWRAALLGVENHWVWYRRNWRATVISSFLQPVLFLLAMGIGFGSQVQPGEATGGLRYAVYLAPALLVNTAVQNTTWESTYSVFSSFKWAKTFLGIVSTPITPAQILYGQLLWITARVTASGLAFVLVAALLGAVDGPGFVLALPFSVLAGMAFSAPVVAFTATRENPDAFNGLFRFVLMPMTLFAGTFFPVDQLPWVVRPIIWLTPVWHGVELARGVAFGTWSLLPALGHVAYLTAMLVVGVVLARKYFQRRLAV